MFCYFDKLFDPGSRRTSFAAREENEAEVILSKDFHLASTSSGLVTSNILGLSEDVFNDLIYFVGI